MPFRFNWPSGTLGALGTTWAGTVIAHVGVFPPAGQAVRDHSNWLFSLGHRSTRTKNKGPKRQSSAVSSINSTPELFSPTNQPYRT